MIKHEFMNLHIILSFSFFLLRDMSMLIHLNEKKGILRKKRVKVREISRLKSSTYVIIKDNIV